MASQSAITSRNIIPSGIKAFTDMLGPVNLDFVGGKYETATEYLATHNVTNLVFDPFNRDEIHNLTVMHQVHSTGCNSITCLNVLNVIDAPEREAIYRHLLSIFKAKGCNTLIFQVYVGNGSGIPEFTDSVNQNNLKLTTYFCEVLTHFASYDVRKSMGKYIIVTKND